MGMPFDMPPSTPPASFFAVRRRPSTTTNGSLCSEPRMPAARKPAPNSMPFTAGMANMIFESSPSTVSKNGSPRPTGTPSQMQLTTPPTLSWSSQASSISWRIASANSSLAARTSFSFAWAIISWMGCSLTSTTLPMHWV